MPYLGVAPNPRENREVDDISSGFNGGTTQFTLQSGGSNVSPGKDTAIIVSLGGVVQNPGTDYTIAASTITFTTAPASGLSFFGVVLAQSIDIETTADNTVTTAKIVDGAITNAKVNASAAIAGTKISPDFGSQNIVTTGSITGNDLEIDSGTLSVDATNNRVGIGTTSPSYKLEVSAETAISGDVRFLTGSRHKFIGGGSGNNLELGTYGNSNTSRNIAMVMDSAGNVGIGTASAAHKLHVADATTPELIIEDTTNNVKAVVGADNSVARIGSDTNHSLTLRTNDTERVRIDTSGNVGIGTTSPSAKLECVGTVLVKENAGFTVQATTPGTTGKLTIIGVNTNSQISAISRLKSVSTDSNSGASALTFETRTTGNAMVERMRILPGGDIGIGTVNPTTNLHVNGTSRVNELLVNIASGHNGSRVHIQGHTTGSHTNIRCANSAGTELFKVRNDNSTFVGALSKSSGSFFIPHPLPSLAATKTLRHSFIEGPQCDNIYRGKVTLSSGTASINLDTVSKMTEGTFVVLNRDVQCFTSNETSYTGVKGSVSGNIDNYF